MKADKFVKKCGPFEVVSISQDGYGVRMEVYPAFPQYGEDWEITRLKGKGGGPSIFTSMGFAKCLEEFLNQPYSQETIEKWKATLKMALGME